MTMELSFLKPIGFWVTYDGNTKYGVFKKPKWLHRKMTKILLGWSYETNKD